MTYGTYSTFLHFRIEKVENASQRRRPMVCCGDGETIQYSNKIFIAFFRFFPSHLHVGKEKSILYTLYSNIETQLSKLFWFNIESTSHSTLNIVVSLECLARKLQIYLVNEKLIFCITYSRTFHTSALLDDHV